MMFLNFLGDVLLSASFFSVALSVFYFASVIKGEDDERN